MRRLLRTFWLPLGLTAAVFARLPVGWDWYGAFTLLAIGVGVGVGIQALAAHLADPELGEDPAFPLGDWWIYTLAAFSVGLIAIDVAIAAAPLVGVLGGRLGYIAYA
jgi:hypothetical protein